MENITKADEAAENVAGAAKKAAAEKTAAEAARKQMQKKHTALPGGGRPGRLGKKPKEAERENTTESEDLGGHGNLSVVEKSNETGGATANEKDVEGMKVFPSRKVIFLGRRHASLACCQVMGLRVLL
ncbi:hypothetical protein L596_011746 [Steinernema carpocapsae]|uniref:Uncharacterized protein n=1 Tax=Steinernema carpocapsae TaxID=34508 RepID=A0A4U5NVU3_STECR|nr:hypothetical protein L596_011746 [Steinernema carpocapsae]